MNVHEYFEFILETEEACAQIRHVLESREVAAGMAKQGFGGCRSTGVSDPTASAAAALEECRSRLKDRLSLLSRLKACGSELLDQLPAESWLQAMGIRYLEGQTVEQAAFLMWYSKRNIYKLIGNAMTWLDASGTYERIVQKHFPEGIVDKSHARY